MEEEEEEEVLSDFEKSLVEISFIIVLILFNYMSHTMLYDQTSQILNKTIPSFEYW
jgi:hypothetical protein